MIKQPLKYLSTYVNVYKETVTKKLYYTMRSYLEYIHVNTQFSLCKGCGANLLNFIQFPDQLSDLGFGTFKCKDTIKG